jgi:hypothetical protein
MNTPPVKTALASAIRGLCLTPLTILLVAAGTLAFLSAPFPVGAQPGEGRAQLA